MSEEKHGIEQISDVLSWLARELEPGLRANETEFVEVSAKDVIDRNKPRAVRNASPNPIR